MKSKVLSTPTLDGKPCKLVTVYEPWYGETSDLSEPRDGAPWYGIDKKYINYSGCFFTSKRKAEQWLKKQMQLFYDLANWPESVMLPIAKFRKVSYDNMDGCSWVIASQPVYWAKNEIRDPLFGGGVCERKMLMPAQ